jgi:hypothetical protein
MTDPIRTLQVHGINRFLTDSPDRVGEFDQVSRPRSLSVGNWQSADKFCGHYSGIEPGRTQTDVGGDLCSILTDSCGAAKLRRGARLSPRQAGGSIEQ